MRLIKLLLVIMAVAVVTLALGGNALAFHGGGVAVCNGCHTMHNSQDGQAITDTPGGGYLLLQADSSSACLRCHAGYGQLTTDGSGYGSGGDYYWITRTWEWQGRREMEYSYGYEHGHNIIAADFQLPNPDPVLTKAPGGSFDSSRLSCGSCHDPHGKGDAPLLLRNNQSYANGTAIFPAGPVMKTLSRRTTEGEDGRETDTNHVAYGSGMSAWCAACHWTFDDDVSHMHPTDQVLRQEIADNYNQYISSADPTGGGVGKTGKYLALVPFETNTDEAGLDTSSPDGPDANSKVACISCHRAHATAFQDAGRWDFTEEFLVNSHPNGTDDLSTPLDKLNSYYGRDIATDFDPEQRSLCNKCHGQDA